jgi:hypothetical protein
LTQNHSLQLVELWPAVVSEEVASTAALGFFRPRCVIIDIFDFGGGSTGFRVMNPYQMSTAARRELYPFVSQNRCAWRKPPTDIMVE